MKPGARCVTLAFSRNPFGRITKGDHNWDWHKGRFNFREVFATLYHRLGIDAERTRFTDHTGRPQSLVGDHHPMPEFIGGAVSQKPRFKRGSTRVARDRLPWRFALSIK